MKGIIWGVMLLTIVGALPVYDVEGLWMQIEPMEIYPVVGKLKINNNIRGGIATFNGTITKGGQRQKLFIEGDIKTASEKTILGRLQLVSIGEKGLQLDVSCFMNIDLLEDATKVEYLVRLKIPSVSDNEIKLRSYSP